MRLPHIRMPLPGPKAQALIERDRLVSTPSYPRDYPFVMQKGRGAEAWDVDGNRFLDFASGIAVCSTGHAHPEVVASLAEVAAALTETNVQVKGRFSTLLVAPPRMNSRSREWA